MNPDDVFTLPYSTPGRLYFPTEPCKWCGRLFNHAHSRAEAAAHISLQIARERGVKFDGATMMLALSDVEDDAYAAWRMKVSRINPIGPATRPATGPATATGVERAVATVTGDVVKILGRPPKPAADPFAKGRLARARKAAADVYRVEVRGKP